jgi:hypothetical protein
MSYLLYLIVLGIVLGYFIRDYRRVSEGRVYQITYPRFGIQSRKDHLRLLTMGIVAAIFLIALTFIHYFRAAR